MKEKQITEKIREQILAHIDFANPDEVEVECCTPTLYSIKYYGIELDVISIYVDEETSECDELYKIVFSYEEIERIGQMAILLDQARDRWGIEALSQPERKKGKWRVYEGEMTCLCCETTFYTDMCEYIDGNVPKFCPWCGAKMEDD